MSAIFGRPPNPHAVVPKSGWALNVAGPGMTTMTSAGYGDGWAVCGYFDVETPFRISAVRCEIVTTPGSAGALLRPMMWADSGERVRPGPLLRDFGTINAETTGLKSIASDLLVPTGRIWYAVVPQGAPVTRPTLRAALNSGQPGSSVPYPANDNIYSQSPLIVGIVGAAPDPAPVPTSNYQICPSLGFIVA